MSPSCILGSFASHHGLLQDNPRGKEQGPAKPGQGAEVRDKLWLTPWAGQSFPVCGVYWWNWVCEHR